MTEPFPHRYATDLAWEFDRRGWISAPPRKGILGGPPPQFSCSRGSDDTWSPEHLLVASANLCLMLTFLFIAEERRLAVASYRSRAEGVLDRAPDGVRFVSISIQVDLKVSEADRAKAETLLQRAKRRCLVANSLKAPIGLTVVGKN